MAEKLYTHTTKAGKEVKFKFNKMGYLAAYELRERALNANGRVTTPILQKELFEHVIRFVDEQGDPVKVSHTWFDEQNEEGCLAEGEAGAMLGNVVNAATEYLFQ